MFLLELIFDGMIDGWCALMHWMVPGKALGKYARAAVKVVVEIFTLLLFIAMVIGVFALISDDAYTKQIGRYMVFIPLTISFLLIILGIAVRRSKKKNDKHQE